MNAAEDHPAGTITTVAAAEDGLIDFEPFCLREGASLREAAQQLVERGLWGIAVVDVAQRYVGTCTLRSIVSGTLPVAADTAVSAGPVARAGAHGLASPRLRAALDRPVTQALDIEVPAVRLSTPLPQLLVVLCRRSPVVPIVSDSGMRLLGMATLSRAVRVLCEK
jgi:CBS domain-containing protein